jgi:hypothetical protein
MWYVNEILENGPRPGSRKNYEPPAFIRDRSVRVLVTDVGKYIVRILAERGHEVRRHKPFEVLSDDAPIEEALGRLLKKEDWPQCRSFFRIWSTDP